MTRFEPADLWCQKRSHYQLSHNHCPAAYLLLVVALLVSPVAASSLIFRNVCCLQIDHFVNVKTYFILVAV